MIDKFIDAAYYEIYLQGVYAKAKPFIVATALLMGECMVASVLYKPDQRLDDKYIN